MRTPFQFPLYSRELPIEIRHAAESRHWQLFPVPVRGRFAKAEAFIKHATSDIAILEGLAYENSGCNWALATGPASGVFAIEASDQSGCASFLAITMKYEEEADWTETLEISRLGIPCAFFQWPENMILNTAHRKIATGLILRGDTDWVLLPPSTVSGVKYTYRDSATPVASPPTWVTRKYFVWQDGQPSNNILPFPRFPTGRGASTIYPAGSALGIILPFSNYSSALSCPGTQHRIQMLFDRLENGSWFCHFIDEDHRTTLPRTVTFPSSDKLIATSECGGALKCGLQRKLLTRAINKGRGGVILQLTDEQYSRLKTSK